MIDLISSFITTLNNLIMFVVNIIKSIILFILNIPYYVTFLSNVITNLVPESILFFFTLSISIYVVLFLLGRETA